MKYKAICENHLYVKAYSKGKKAIGKHVVLYVLKDYKADVFRKQNLSKETINRIGLTVTKKNGNAVLRTRIRRILREAYRILDHEYTIKKGFLVVIVAKPSCADVKTQDVKKDLYSSLKKLDMIV